MTLDGTTTPATLPEIWAARFSADRDGASMTTLYAPDAALWGTFATSVCVGHAAIRAYFAGVKRRASGMTAQAVRPVHVMEDGALAVLSGVFAAQDPDHARPLGLRYTITLVKRGEWLILAHHSSLMPEAS